MFAEQYLSILSTGHFPSRNQRNERRRWMPAANFLKANELPRGVALDRNRRSPKRRLLFLLRDPPKETGQPRLVLAFLAASSRAASISRSKRLTASLGYVESYLTFRRVREFFRRPVCSASAIRFLAVEFSARQNANIAIGVRWIRGTRGILGR